MKTVNERAAEHYQRCEAKRQAMPKIPCACECGTMIPPITAGASGKPLRFARGHHRAGAETRFRAGRETWNKGKPHPASSAFHKGRKRSLASIAQMIATRTARGTWPPTGNKGRPHPMRGIQKTSSFGVGGYRDDLGFYVRSRWEANYARYLTMIGKPFVYEPECFIVTIDDGTQHAYRPDFLVDGAMYVEIKGWDRNEHRPTTKILEAAKRQLPLPLTVIRRGQYYAYAATVAHKIPLWEYDRDPRPGFFREPCRACGAKMKGKPLEQIYCSTKCTPRPFTGRQHSAESIARRTATRLANNGGTYFKK